MAGFTVRVDDAQLRAALTALAARLGNMQDVFDAIGGRLVNLARIGFTQERSPDGAAWKPLATATILARTKAKHWPGPILRVKGERGLYGSLNYKPSPTSVEIGAGWGPSSAYAAIHQVGGQAGRGRRVTIPARPFLPATSGTLPDAYLSTCLDIINQAIGGVRG